MVWLKRPLMRFAGPRGVPVEIQASVVAAYAAGCAFLLALGMPITTVLLLVAIFVFSLLVHEWGHAWIALQNGVRPKEIVLAWSAARCELPAMNATKAVWITLAGPGANLFMATVCFGAATFGVLGLMLAGGNPTGMMADWNPLSVLVLAVAVNLMLAALNLLPFQPFDGGHVLHLGLAHLLPVAIARRLTGAIGLAVGIAWIVGNILALLTWAVAIPVWPGPLLHWRMMAGQNVPKGVMQLYDTPQAAPA